MRENLRDIYKEETKHHCFYMDDYGDLMPSWAYVEWLERAVEMAEAKQQHANNSERDAICQHLEIDNGGQTYCGLDVCACSGKDTNCSLLR